MRTLLAQVSPFCSCNVNNLLTLVTTVNVTCRLFVQWMWLWWYEPGVISRGNAISIVKVFKIAHKLAVHASWTALRIPAKNAPGCRILLIQSQKFSGGYPQTLTDVSPVIGPRHQFLLGSLVFQLFLFYEMTNGMSWQLMQKRMQVHFQTVVICHMLNADVHILWSFSGFARWKTVGWINMVSTECEPITGVWGRAPPPIRGMGQSSWKLKTFHLLDATEPQISLILHSLQTAPLPEKTRWIMHQSQEQPMAEVGWMPSPLRGDAPVKVICLVSTLATRAFVTRIF